MASPASGSTLPLRPALRVDSDNGMSPRSGPAKVVSIAEPGPGDIALPPPAIDDVHPLKQFNARLAKRFTGRPSLHSSTSKYSTMSKTGMEDILSPKDDNTQLPREPRHRHHERLLGQVSCWLEAEKAKRAARKAKRHTKEDAVLQTPDVPLSISPALRPRTNSDSSDASAISLEKLQQILADHLSHPKRERPSLGTPILRARRPSSIALRRGSSRSIRGFASSDTEHTEGDVVVPSCDVTLDNSKTLTYGTESSARTVTLSSSKRAEKERQAWTTFKSEIVRLAHTLKLKGWRRVPLEKGSDIEVQRLSGALTNAVYVVSPPEDLPPTSFPQPLSLSDVTQKQRKSRYPAKILLRIYGPQVEHLIDRENELNILRRLARKKIGPRLLGTFRNGRFEEFFDATTLTAKDLRIPDTSKQIAKRMRELHDGIELLPRERDEGPFIWRNWDKWVDRCENIISFLDKQTMQRAGFTDIDGGESPGFVCGVEWPKFRSVVDKYRAWLGDHYGGAQSINRRLVFAHNDTQYGNILRINTPAPTSGSAPSPLLLPANEHKQLIVIDFEYASANSPGLEFANHFTEWCYNYHDATRNWHCDTIQYPNVEEQKRFIRAYVNHRPQFHPTASATPKFDGKEAAPGSISAFMLDARSPGDSTSSHENSYVEQEEWRQRDLERQVDQLLQETRIWRFANSAQWVAWGIMQAQIPDMDPSNITDSSPTASPTELKAGSVMEEHSPEVNGSSQGISSDKRPDGMVAESQNGETTKEAKVEDEDESDEFDYLAFAQDRAMFFWGDAVLMGFVKKEELPEGMQKRLKIVEH